MNREVIEYNGIQYRHIEMTPERFSVMVKKFAKHQMNKRDFKIFEIFDVQNNYAELVQYGELYCNMLDLCESRYDLDMICDYIEDLFDNIGEIIEPISEN